MKNFFTIFLFVFILGAVVYQFKFIQTPCEEPIPYTLGTFNTKFNISESYFLSALSDAEAVWEKPFDKELFTYVPEGSSRDLKINLIYDYRQEATSKLASLGITVKDDKASYDVLKAKFTALKAEYEKETSAWDAQVEAFNQKQLAYEKEVKYWNAKGGAPQKEYEKLERERLVLEAESRELQKTQNDLNQMVEEINALVVVLNRLTTTLNLSVDKYNTINVTRGESFEEGIYFSDGFERKIDIYEFSSRAKLVRVLAHELGHALDLPHVDDPKAIMYEFNQGNTETLTEADLDALKIKCKTK